MPPNSASFAAAPRRPRPAVLVAIVLLHLAAIYGLARAFAPGAVASAESAVLSSITVTVRTPPPSPPPPPPEPAPQPDPGSAGAPGKKAVPRAVTAPVPPVIVKPAPPAPVASSTGSANSAGARDEGAGTGAAGSGAGTGSGAGGNGQGGGIATRPQWVGGRIDDARDYPIPPGGREARVGTSVVVRVVVGTDGRARDCRVYRPSPDAEADAITCRLVEQRLRFRPATDSAGNPVAAPFFWQQRWF